jgi:hypothetical protein
MGKEVIRRTNGTKERWEMNFARFGYGFVIDPRFNGSMRRLGTMGLGQILAIHITCVLGLKNHGVGKPLVRLSRRMKHK